MNLLKARLLAIARQRLRDRPVELGALEGELSPAGEVLNGGVWTVRLCVLGMVGANTSARAAMGDIAGHDRAMIDMIDKWAEQFRMPEVSALPSLNFAAELPDLAQELRLNRLAVENAAREADSRHARGQVMEGFRRITAATKANSTVAMPVRPVQRQEAQEAVILSKLVELRFEPLALPLPLRRGLPSPAKQAVQQALRLTPDVMKKAWQRLRNAGKIRDAGR